VLAASGLGSRRTIEAMIEAGSITVNGRPAELGQRIAPGDRVKVGGRPVQIGWPRRLPRVMLYHKPVGEIVSRSDPQRRPTVFANLPSLGSAKWVAVGRLDINSEGLLLFTTSGELANRLMHPRYAIEREYAVRVMGRLQPEQIEAMRRGVALEDGLARVLDVREAGGEGANAWYTVVLPEGRKREVRRVFEALGLVVSRLIRTRYGPIVLPRELRRGRMRELEPREVQALLDALAPAPAAPAEPAPGSPAPDR
jgi:23S rRNA pseudouridine2605 synthase